MAGVRFRLRRARTHAMMQHMPETAEPEPGEARSEETPAARGGAAPNEPGRSTRGRALRLVAGATGVAVLAGAVAIALASRVGLGTPTAVAPPSPQPALTVAPQLTPSAPPPASPS